MYCNISRSTKIAFLEVEKAMFTFTTPIPLFTIITPSPKTRNKQSKSFHTKCNLKVNREKNVFEKQK